MVCGRLYAVGSGSGVPLAHVTYYHRVLIATLAASGGGMEWPNVYILRPRFLLCIF